MSITHVICSRLAQLALSSRNALNGLAVLVASSIEACLFPFRCRFLRDVGRLKRIFFRRLEADTLSKEADARWKSAQAQDAQNRVIPAEHQVRVRQLELEKLKAASHRKEARRRRSKRKSKK